MENGDLYTLWRKEKAPNNNSYVDISSTECSESANDQKLKKNNVIAEKLREKGNKLYAQKKYHDAIACYNESIAYAENDTEALSFAFANRSNCFLRLERFQECLIDIRLAEEAGYPSSRISKLDNREQDCKDMMTKSSNKSYVRAPQLDFDENQHYPGVADCLKIANNSTFGRHVVTTRDLKIGQTILIEKPFAFKHEPMDSDHSPQNYDPFVDKSRIIEHDRSGKHTFGRCGSCYVECANLIPCKKCAGLLFCDEVCMKKGYHQFDCKMPDNSRKETFGVVLRMLYRANDAFPCVNELMRTVELLLTGANVNGLQNDQKSFSMIFQLPTNKEHQWSRNLKLARSATISVFNRVMRLPEFRGKFTSLEHRRFLKHLILHLFHIAEHAINAHEYWHELKDAIGSFRLRTFGNGMYPFGCYINHSCTPNICWYFVDHRLICRVIRPIKKGSQLFGSYL